MPGRSDVRPEAVDVAGPSADATSTSRRRPKDRADQILLAAAQLFRERGYHAVGIDDIGAAVGISGPSVYRHFDSKEALLVAATERAASRYGSMYGEALAAVTPQERVAGIVRRSVTGAIEDRDISAIYYREYRHIARERRQPIQRMIEELREQWVAPLVAVRPELTREQARFLWRSVSGLNRSIVYFPRPPMPRTRWVETLTRMGLAAVLAGPRHVDGQDGDTAMTVAQVLPVLVANDPESSREPSVFSTTVSRGSRREAILAVAVRLFRQHGYGGVGIEDVGAAAGITGPGVYRHFESKEEILAAAFNRASEQLAASVSRAFDIAATPQEALERLIASYAEITVENRDLFSVWMTEGHSLGPRGAAEFRRSQGAYLDDWMGVLGELRPALSEPEKRVMARGALGIVAGYTLGRVRLPLAQLRPTLVTITLAALDA